MFQGSTCCRSKVRGGLLTLLLRSSLEAQSLCCFPFTGCCTTPARDNASGPARPLAMQCCLLFRLTFLCRFHLCLCTFRPERLARRRRPLPLLLLRPLTAPPPPVSFATSCGENSKPSSSLLVLSGPTAIIKEKSSEAAPASMAALPAPRTGLLPAIARVPVPLIMSAQ